MSSPTNGTTRGRRKFSAYRLVQNAYTIGTSITAISTVDPFPHQSVRHRRDRPRISRHALTNRRPGNSWSSSSDGAPAWQRFRHITLPALRPGFTLVAVYEAMVAVRHFDLFFLLTEGGPGNASDVVAWRIYVETFRNLNFGLGAAMAYILALATLLMSYGLIWSLAHRV